MSYRSFFIGDRNEQGLFPFKVRLGHYVHGVLVEEDDKIAELTDDELRSIEEQAHQRRAEAN